MLSLNGSRSIWFGPKRSTSRVPRERVNAAAAWDKIKGRDSRNGCGASCILAIARAGSIVAGRELGSKFVSSARVSIKAQISAGGFKKRCCTSRCMRGCERDPCLCLLKKVAAVVQIGASITGANTSCKSFSVGSPYKTRSGTSRLVL